MEWNIKIIGLTLNADRMTTIDRQTRIEGVNYSTNDWINTDQTRTQSIGLR